MRFGTRRVRQAVAIGLAGVLLLGACGSDSNSSSGSGGGSGKALLIARGMDVNSLDPQRAYCDTCQIFMTAVYETLIGLDKDNTTLVDGAGNVAVSSNKGALALLWEMAPRHPNLLPCYFLDDDRKTEIGDRFAQKPIWSREGSNVLLVDGEDVVGQRVRVKVVKSE